MARLNIKRMNKKSKIGNLLYNHIVNNKRGYFFISILFFVGIVCGVIFINNTNDIKLEEINNYLKNLVNNIKKYDNIDFRTLFKESIVYNFMIIFILWLSASTIIGIPIVCGLSILKGFNIGYTISSIISCFGIGRGMLISISIMIAHNIIFIPTMFATSISGIRMYQAIMKNSDKDNMKLEILRHTLFCILMLIFMIISSIIEVYVSTNIFINILKKINL